MSKKLSYENLGEPDLKIAGLQLWVHGRQFPDAEDEYDGNWLRVTAHSGGSGASVWVHGAILMVTDIARFGNECAAMLQGDSESATLDSPEPELKVTLKASDGLGHIRVEVEITPDRLFQAHWFEFEVDQSHLPELIRKCARIVLDYPIRGLQGRESV
ncbi:MAG TPA: hypothetical protein PLH94_03125 [Fimbriimonadaceae bacterium]|nr:hypothetical protein [Fimbriimonadaceae bacterium]